MGTPRVLSTRALNRAVLERQHLLEPADVPVETAVGSIQGLNAQNPNDPYLALWTRLRRFSGADLISAIEQRRLVRAVTMRGTQHLVTSADFVRLRPALAPLLRRQQRNTFGRRTAGVELAELVADARDLLASGLLTRSELSRALAESRPGADVPALGWSVQLLEPLVHPAPVGSWNYHGPMLLALADDWLDSADVRQAPTDEHLDRLVLRYLRAFGPATPSDARAWSGVSGLREVFGRLRGRLRVYRNENGRELFDLPDAPRPSPDVDAPIRFLAEFDAPLLAYHDRTRMMSDEVRRRVCVGDAVAATVLVGGDVAATWSMHRSERPTLSITPMRPLSAAERSGVEAEGERLLAFVAPDATDRDIRFVRGE